jgi:hypothetical protein
MECIDEKFNADGRVQRRIFPTRGRKIRRWQYVPALVMGLRVTRACYGRKDAM